MSCAHSPYRIGLPEKDEVRPENKTTTAVDYNVTGVKYESVGQYEKAIKAYKKRLAADPGNHIARTNLGNVLAKLCRFERAEECYRQVLSEDPKNLAAMNNLAWLLVSAGDARNCEEGVALAGDCLSLATRVAPSVRPSVFDTLAWGNYRLERQSEAILNIRKAVELLGPADLNNNPLIWGHYRTILKMKEAASSQPTASEPSFAE